MNRVCSAIVRPSRLSLYAGLIGYVCAVLFFGCTKSTMKKPVMLAKPAVVDTTARTKKSDKTQTMNTQKSTTPDSSTSAADLSPAAQLVLMACDNYLSLNPHETKADTVLNIKGSVYYNNKMYEKCRTENKRLLQDYPQSPLVGEAVRTIAQSYYEEKSFDEAQKWYRKLKDVAGTSVDKEEAVNRITESIFKQAELLSQKQVFGEAAAQYERVALEFPEAKIADVALYNAGWSYEKQIEWSHAILVYQRLIKNHPGSKLVTKTRFQTARCYEKLMQWDNAADAYLRVVAANSESEEASAAIYNAASCFENGGKTAEAAATFEKMASLYPKNTDAADVLFRAGELYGKLKDWVSVSRVTDVFTQRFGNDQGRVVQALCMRGVALYMQNMVPDAIVQLEKTVMVFGKLKEVSTVNKYYAAKAEYTLGEIYQAALNKIPLRQPGDLYKRLLKEKTDYLDKTITAYSHVVKYGISEWTTRGIFQIGQAYEDFAVALFKQERPAGQSLKERLALELGIAQAVEEYFVAKAVHYHEQNILLGIKEKLEDKYVLESHKKLVQLPCMAGKNYLALVDISQNSQTGQNATGMAAIGQKLEMLQNAAPFQERAIILLLAALERGSKYKQIDTFYAEASLLVTRTSFTVGKTYAEVGVIAREAPMPKVITDPYDRFIYKTKLLNQIQTYEEKALENFLRTLKIAEAYTINDEYVNKTREEIAQLLFARGRCMEQLCTELFSRNPPFPTGANEAEKEEYRAKFEEYGLNFQEKALEVYRQIMKLDETNQVAGPAVTHAYVRLYQDNPKEYGFSVEKTDTITVSSGPDWKCTADSLTAWNSIDYEDRAWSKVQRIKEPAKTALTGFPDKTPVPMWLMNIDTVEHKEQTPCQRVFFRYPFYNNATPHNALLFVAAFDDVTIYLNGNELSAPDTARSGVHVARSIDLTGMVRQGKNVLAIVVVNRLQVDYGLYPVLTWSVTGHDYQPRLPKSTTSLDRKSVAKENYKFPVILLCPEASGDEKTKVR